MTPAFSNSNLPINTYDFVSIANDADGGAIGTAAATVDVYPGAEMAQTSASQTFTLPTPTGSVPRRFTVLNVGSVSFTMYQKVIFPGTGLTFYYTNVSIPNQGPSWIPSGGVSATLTTTTTT